MIEKFCARFTPNGTVLLRGGTRRDGLPAFADELSELGVDADEHFKLPDAIVSVAERNWLVLLQAASSRGPIDEDRRDELRSLFVGAGADLVYVSCFTTRAELRDYPTDFAWGSSVWCADEPDHLIHFGGGRLLGPYGTSTSAALRS